MLNFQNTKTIPKQTLQIAKGMQRRRILIYMKNLMRKLTYSALPPTGGWQKGYETSENSFLLKIEKEKLEETKNKYWTVED